jgi:protein tyrosine phosphatase (PTP) superfamily phosphohydrolase (DUF442 family)
MRMHASIRALAVCAAALGAAGTASGAPNRVEISPRLVTSGQPTAQALAELGAQGYGAVIYLAPPTVPDAVADEARIVGRQGLVFVNLPIAFDAPTAADVSSFNALLQALLPALGERKLLVHCQINLRASTLVFLYRATVRREDPAAAWAAVSRVWTPDGAWRRLVEQQLAAHGVRFDPF